jgi:predicted lipid-binding transport protein (Tim44 family)
MKPVWMRKRVSIVRRVVQIAAAAALAVGWLAAAAPVQAQSISKPSSDNTKQARASISKPMLGAHESSSSGLSQPLPKSGVAASAARLPLWWLLGGLLGATLLGSATWGWYRRAAQAAAPAAAQKRRRSAGSAHAARGRSYEQEQLGVETWVPAAPKLVGNVQYMATQPVPKVKEAAGELQAASASVPRDFDAAAFEREAKVLFMRLTTAWDSHDDFELKRLIAPASFDTLVRQIEAAHGDSGAVNILTLEAQVLRATSGSGADTAEVRFFGLYRAVKQTAAKRFDCVWSLMSDAGSWRLTAIQSL